MSTNFTPTPEQLAIVAAARDTQDGLAVQALAGAAKTSTLVLIAEALSSASILALSFNKAIATEMAERLPANCTSSTLHSLGFRSFQDFAGRTKADFGKMTKLWKRVIEKLSSEEQEAAWEGRREILEAVSWGKACGWLPDAAKTGGPRRLISTNDFRTALDPVPTDFEWDLINTLSLQSYNDCFTTSVDGDDMVLLPAVLSGCTFPHYDVVLVDESQDLSPINHVMLRKLTRNGARLIIVGDPYQAIYGFRGADEESMDTLINSFGLRRLDLTVSFRCPQAVVEAARFRAPHMQFPEWAKPGSVTKLEAWTVNDLPEEAAIICRNNAPLLAIAFSLIREGLFPIIKKDDLKNTLLKKLEKLSRKLTTPREELLTRINRLEAKEKARYKNTHYIEDQMDCLRTLCAQGEDLGEILAKTKALFERSGTIQLLTIHGSKGLEWPHVFILDEHLIRPEGQDLNLRYVAITRAKETLTYITSEGFMVAAEDA